MRGFFVVFFSFAALLSPAPAQTHSSDSRAAAVSDSATDAPSIASHPPKAKQEVVEETLHGVTVRDPYRYLEDANNPDTKQFVEQQMAYTQGLLDRLPGRNEIHHRLEELFSIGTISAPQIGQREGTNYYLYTRREGKQNQPVLYVREGLNGADRVLVDVNARNAAGTTALDWWFPTHDGAYVCFGTSENGSEISTLQVIETATGKLLPEHIERTRAASVAWKRDNSGFYYTRYPHPGDVPKGEEAYHRKVFYHQLASAPDGSADSLIFFYDKDPQAWPNVNIADDEDRWLLISVSQGWTKVNLFLKDLSSKAPPQEITENKDFLYSGDIYKGSIYITSNEDAPRFRVFKADTSSPERSHWKQIIPQSSDPRGAVLQNAAVVSGKLLVTAEKDVTAQVKIFDFAGKHLADVKMPGLGSIASLGGNYDGKEVFFDYQSFTTPMTVYRVDMTAESAPVSEWEGVKTSIDPARYDVRQVFYPSKDGTKIPMFLVSKQGIKLDSSTPAYLTGYGGFNVSNSPTFRLTALMWADRGGLFALANLRGGAEYGEDWHRAGMLEHKQNVFDDFISAAEYLIAEKYTSREKLAIEGGSNGGLLVGAALTQRPDLFRAVLCRVPLLDMLRYQNFQIAKLWIPEYGSADDAEQFKWLYSYSPYHHVKPGVQYPAILFMSADTDTRVDPMHAKKMAALMQAEAANGQGRERPILLRIETKAGHGAGKPIGKQVDEYTDMFSFLFWQLGMEGVGR
jgi:prolyl oligopeptidase